jgi:hypothetical protein
MTMIRFSMTNGKHVWYNTEAISMIAPAADDNGMAIPGTSALFVVGMRAPMHVSGTVETLSQNCKFVVLKAIMHDGDTDPAGVNPMLVTGVQQHIDKKTNTPILGEVVLLLTTSIVLVKGNMLEVVTAIAKAHQAMKDHDHASGMSEIVLPEA